LGFLIGKVHDRLKKLHLQVHPNATGHQFLIIGFIGSPFIRFPPHRNRLGII